MQMHRFLLVMMLSALATLVLIVMLPLVPGMKTDPSAPWIEGMYKQKLAALHGLPGNRIYVVSGSSSLFSMDTKVLSQATGRPVVNLATHAGLGLAYILDRVEREIQPGDTILFTPEYPLLQKSSDPTELTIQYVTFFDRPYIASRPLVEQAHYYLGYGFLNAFVETLKAIRTGRQVGRDDLTNDDLGNARGNTVALSVKDKTEFGPGGEPRPITPDAIATLQKFAERAREKHATIIALPSALIHMPGWDTQAQRAFRTKARQVFKQTGMISLGDDQTGWVEPDGIYDTAAHANDAGRAVFTARIARVLCREIRCANPPQ